MTPEQLLSQIDSLGPDERAVVELVVDGLVRGRAQYGELDIDDDPRDFVQEAIEELRDTAIYGAIEAIRARRKIARLSALLREAGSLIGQPAVSESPSADIATMSSIDDTGAPHADPWDGDQGQTHCEDELCDYHLGRQAPTLDGAPSYHSSATDSLGPIGRALADAETIRLHPRTGAPYHSESERKRVETLIRAESGGKRDQRRPGVRYRLLPSGEHHPLCRVDGCDRLARTRGLCRRHATEEER